MFNNRVCIICELISSHVDAYFNCNFETGYYRVNYDDNTWSSIAQILHKSYSTVHNLNRGQVSSKHSRD